MKKKLRSAFKTSKYLYIEQKHDGPQEITVLFNTIVKIKGVLLLDHKILYLDSQLQKIYMPKKMQRWLCFQDQN
jgi:hypothetical protein